jgi:Phage integrase family
MVAQPEVIRMARQRTNPCRSVLQCDNAWLSDLNRDPLDFAHTDFIFAPIAILRFWASLFPGHEPHQYVFLAERYGASGDGLSMPMVYESDPTKPIGRWKGALEAAKIRAGVRCRFRDVRHTGCTRMLEAGAPFSVVATIIGWRASTTVRMAERYGHIGQAAQRQAVDTLNRASFQADGARHWAQFQTPRVLQLAN